MPLPIDSDRATERGVGCDGEERRCGLGRGRVGPQIARLRVAQARPGPVVGAREFVGDDHDRRR